MRKFGLVLLGVLLSATSALADDRPNILLLVAEDMSHRIGAFGDPVAVTPNLDRLAEQGTRYPNAFTTAGVCAPSRAALITGVHQNRLNAQHMRTKSPLPFLASGGPIPYEAVPPAEVKAFPELLRAHGYYTFNLVKTDYQFGEPFTIWDRNATDAHWRDREGADREKPFFGMVNFMSTHESGLFPVGVWPTSVTHAATQLAVWLRMRGFEGPVRPEDVVLPPYYPDTPAVRETVAQHYNNIAFMDGEVGRWLADLEQDGLLENTIVIFTTDHGDGLPRAKRTLYDSGIRVPMIVRWPAHLRPESDTQGAIKEELVSFLSMAPTLLELAGAQRPDHLKGRVFLGAGVEASPRYIHAARDRIDTHMDRVRAVRDGHFKYVRNDMPELPYMFRLAFRDHLVMMDDLYAAREAGEIEGRENLLALSRAPEEFYDLQADPDETRNLVDDPDYQDDLIRMRAELDRWLAAEGDTPQAEADMINQQWPGMTQPITAPVTISHGVNDKLHMTSATEGASIGYSTDGGDHWALYSGPISVSPGTVIVAKAIRYGYQESAVTLYEGE